MVFSEQKLYLLAAIAFSIGFILLIILSLTLKPEVLETALTEAKNDQELTFQATITDLQVFPSGATRVVFTRNLEESGFIQSELNETVLFSKVKLTGVKNDDFFTITSLEIGGDIR